MGASHLRTRLYRAYCFAKGFFRDLDETRTTGMAAEMAFWLFLSLIPLAAVAGLVAAKIAVSSSEVGSMLASLPPQTRELVGTQLGQVAAWNGGAVGAPAAVVFIWLASGGVNSVFELLEVKAGGRRSWWRRRLVAIATCIGLSVGTAVIGVLIAGLSRMAALVGGLVPLANFYSDASWIGTVMRFVVGAATAVSLVAGLYWAGIPRNARREFRIWPGALAAVGLQAAFGYGYVFYLSKAGSSSAYQAGLSIIGVSLMALYLFAVALLVGAELNHLLSSNGSLKSSAAELQPRSWRIAEPPQSKSDVVAGPQPSSRMPPSAR